MSNREYRYWLATVSFAPPAPEMRFAAMTYSEALREDLDRGGSSYLRIASCGAHDLESLVQSDSPQAHRLIVQATIEHVIIRRHYTSHINSGLTVRVEPHPDFTRETAPDPIEIVGSVPVWLIAE